MKRILGRIHFCILVVWGFFVFKARDEPGYKMNEKIREKRCQGKGDVKAKAMQPPAQGKISSSGARV